MVPAVVHTEAPGASGQQTSRSLVLLAIVFRIIPYILPQTPADALR